MSNRIVYDDFIFTDADIISGSIHLENSMVAETLGGDTLTFVVQSEAIGKRFLKTSAFEYFCVIEGRFCTNDGDLVDYDYGAPCLYYHNNVLMGKFYIKKITRIAKWQFKIECISAIGLLSNVTHYGGVYVNQSVTSLFQSVMNTIGYTLGTDYTIASDVQAQSLSGWLPIASARDNLQQICFALGCSVLKSNGVLNFTYNENVTPQEIESSRLYVGGSIDYKTPATKIVVTEHTYYYDSSVATVTLFDNSAVAQASNEVVTFDNPVYASSLATTGTLTIISRAENFAIVSGLGTLKGKPYTHLTKELTYDTGIDSEPYEYRIENATLVGVTNSYYVAKRVGNYYSESEDVNYGLVMQNEYTGEAVTFTDPFEREQTGYIKQMDVTISNILKANAVISTDFSIGPFGNNFVDYLIIHSGATDLSNHLVGLNGLSGTFNPSTYGLNGQRVRAVVFSGAKGGQGGTDGQASWLVRGSDPSWGAGNGGLAGAGGKGLYYITQDLTMSGSYAVSLGQGGAGGTRVAYGQSQQAGGGNNHSTFGAMSSSSGLYIENGYLNVLSRELYGQAGKSGYAGQSGNVARVERQVSGRTFGYVGQKMYRTWYGGRYSTNIAGVTRYSGIVGSYKDSYVYEDDAYVYTENVGAGGGGAAYGANGGDGSPTTLTTPTGGETGGLGASVTGYDLTRPTLGRAGNGGCGGGGGGCAGFIYNWYYGYVSTYGANGQGGQGCAGQPGSNGFILIYSPIAIV